jgi:hypothetical protein
MSGGSYCWPPADTGRTGTSIVSVQQIILRHADGFRQQAPGAKSSEHTPADTHRGAGEQTGARSAGEDRLTPAEDPGCKPQPPVCSPTVTSHVDAFTDVLAAGY